MSDASAPADVIDLLAAIEPNSRVARLRLSNEDARRATQASFEALFEPEGRLGLTRAERELVALRVAVLEQDAPLAAFHRERARSQRADAALLQGTERQVERPVGDNRWTEVLRFVDRLTLEPALARASHVKALHRYGLVARDVVTLAQLVAYTNYAVRLLAGLRALAAPPATDGAAANARLFLWFGSEKPLSAPSRPTPPARGFTLEPLEWTAWLPTLELAQADPERLAVLGESHAAARTSPFYLTLIHEPAVLRQRSRLFDAIMNGQHGLPHADRELTTVAVSIVNGCAYCASVQARRFALLSEQPQAVRALFDHGLEAPLAPRRRALVDLAAALSESPPAPLAHPLSALRAVGMSDAELLDAIHVAAIFAWENRLIQTLGQPAAFTR